MMLRNPIRRDLLYDRSEHLGEGESRTE